MQSLDLSIIIVNWNSADYVQQCIESIYKHTRSICFEVIVIDNASFDDCKKMLAREYPKVRFVQLNKNIGFGKANNCAFVASVGKYILFLNPDTQIENDAICIMHKVLESREEAGAVGAKLLNSDRSIQKTCVRTFPKIINELFEIDILQSRYPKSMLWKNISHYLKSKNVIQVDAISGACMMFRRSVFIEIGMFSDDFFMYSEDVDICLKAKRLGWKILYVPNASIVHHGGGSISKDSINRFSDVMLLESRWRFFKKNYSLWYGQFFRIVTFFSCALRLFTIIIFWPLLRLIKDKKWLTKSIIRWKSKLQWSLGIENWVQKY